MFCKKGTVVQVLSLVLAISLLLPACAESPTVTPTSKPAATAASVATVAPTVAPTKAAAATATPAKPTPKTGGIITVAMVADGTNGHFDTAMFRDRSVAMWWGGIYESILGHDMDTFEIVPRLAEKWELSTDAKSVTLTLRKGARWHNVAPVNGREFTSADIKWNLERIRDLKTPGQWTSAFKGLIAVETPDPYTAKLVFKDAYAPIIFTLADASLMMYPHELFDTYGEKQTKVAIGTGPFMFKSYEPELSLKMVKNPNYYIPGMPRVDEVDIVVIKDKAAQLAALRTGQISYLDSLNKTDADNLRKSNPELQIFSYAGLAYDLRINAKKKPLDDQRVRKAISLAIDRQAAITLCLQGAGDLIGVYFPDVAPHAALRSSAELAKLPGFRQPKDQDIADAKKLLADAGYANGLTIESYVFSGQPEIKCANEVFQQQLKVIGIDWQMRLGDYAQVGDATKTTGDYQVAMWYTRSGDADVLYGNHSTKSATNIMGWGSPELDALLEAGRVEPDNAKRAAIYRQIEDKVVDMATDPPLFISQNFMAVRPEYKELRPMTGAALLFFEETYRFAWIDK